jgi:nitrogen regulatory protein PII
MADDPPRETKSTLGLSGVDSRKSGTGLLAIIRQENLDNVRECLTSIGVEGLTVMDVLGFGRQMGRTEVYRGCEYRVDFHPKVLLTILTRDDQVDEIVDAIIKGARTGKIGDGKIVVTSIDEVIRIRTGEIGKAAV